MQKKKCNRAKTLQIHMHIENNVTQTQCIAHPFNKLKKYIYNKIIQIIIDMSK